MDLTLEEKKREGSRNAALEEEKWSGPRKGLEAGLQCPSALVFPGPLAMY